MPDLPPPMPTQEQVATALADCGLNRTGLSIAYDDDLQSDVVRIKVAARATDKQFACIRSATQYYDVSFEDAGQRKAYGAFVAVQLRSEMIADARKQLAAIGKLEGMPIFGQFPDTASFFRALEAHCGLKPGQVFQETSLGEWNILPQDGIEILTCPMGVLLAQEEDLSAKGLRFGFVGNEAFSEQ